jgi:Flp pilus assembly pilin Flp
MSDLMISTASRAQVAIYSISNKLVEYARGTAKRIEEQTGQDMVEYAGVLLIVVAIIAAVISLHIETKVQHAVSDALNKIGIT